MKQLQWMVVIVSIGILSACGVQAPLTPQPFASVSTNSFETAKEYLIRGDNFSAIKDYGHAILDYDQAIHLRPEYAEAYNNRGYAYYWKGDATQAIADYSRAIELRPNYAYAYNNRGAAYMASGHPDQAISDFNHALELQPDFPQAYINRGNAYLRLGHFGLALADFRQGGANPVRTIAPLCGIPAITILLGALIMNIVRQHLLAKKRRTIEMK
jgi:tetratricopeptide (TPR) repeat protein